MDGTSQNGNQGDQGQGGNGAGNEGGQQQQSGNQGQQQSTGNNQNQEIDFSTLTTEQLEKVLENQEVWKSPRLTKLLEANKELEKIKNQQTEQERKQLEENNKHKELAESYKTDLEKANTKIQDLVINQSLTGELVKAGVIDIDAALKLIDRSKLKIENDQVAGVDEALKGLKESKAYLFNNNGTQSLGGPNGSQGNEGGQQQTKFKRSQLQDPKFFEANKPAIMEAYKNGQIEDDLS